MATPGGTLPAIPPDIAWITGPTMLGICFNWGFMGLLVVQLYFYHSNFPSDNKTIKALVYGLFTLDILQTVLVTADSFHWFVFGFGNMDRLDDTFLNSWDVPMLDAVIALIVQVFYCWRIYVLRKTLVYPILITLVSIIQCTFGIVTAVKANELGKLSLIGSTKAKVAFQTIWLVGGAVADVAIAIVLSWTLLRARSKTFAKSHRVINRIVQLTVETNALTAGVAVIAVVVYLAVPAHTTLVVPPTAIIGKLYTNCLIAVLNNRPIQADGSTSGASRTAALETAASANLPNFRAPKLGKVHIVERMDQTESTMEMSAFGKDAYGSEP
ncbi:hypothetical protein DFH06DRAFT_1184372 [Mycena polygramma]|nr:hypothetical protein DFH06DRAFT_1187684 [Mycena polygramma]KAJ7666644.1 hypothetical protein DFH06DRAFT_1184372 [Mycena polygramma]